LEPVFDSTAKAGTLTGTLLTFFAFVSQTDLFRTAVLAAIGAVVSFCVTHALKRLMQKKRKQ
jgi:mannitol-specific phosphotransferase system IIBC component